MPLEVPSAPANGLFDVDGVCFRCTLTAGGDEAWVRASGEIDVASAPVLQRALDEAQTRAPLVVLDLNDLAFIDSSGVHVIVDASKQARSAGHRIVVLCRPRVRDVFELTRTIDDVEVHQGPTPRPLDLGATG